MGDAKPIILTTDFSPASLAGLGWARRIAVATDAPLHVIYVVEEPQVYRALDIRPDLSVVPTVKMLTGAAEQRLAALVAAQLDDPGVSVSTEVLTGKPADEIARYAEDQSAAMIVIGAHGYSGLRHLVLGSTSEATLRQAGCPVLCVRATD